MKGLFKQAENGISAKLCLIKSGGSSPLFMKSVIAANCRNSFNGIPVMILGGYMITADPDVGEISITGKVENPKDIKIISEIGKILKDIDTSSYPKSEFGFILVYEDMGIRVPGDSDLYATGVIHFKKITKFKYRYDGITIEGLSDSFSKGKKNFVVDTEGDE